MNFRDYLTVADELSDADSEAHWRSAISRAYYAAFHVMKRTFQDVGVCRAAQGGSCVPQSPLEQFAGTLKSRNWAVG